MSKTQKYTWSTAGTLLALFPAYLLAHIAGPDPRHTGGPGDDKLACATALCHTGSAKGGPINANPGYGVFATFSSGCTYTPGVPITITIQVTDPVNTHYGFQMSARLESDTTNGQAGDFTAGTNQIVRCDAPFGAFKGPKGCPTGQKVQFIEHSFDMNAHASTAPYKFTWTPPTTNAGNVHFYVAGNAVNDNIQEDAGDHVYTNEYVLTPLITRPTPTMCEGCVLNAASYALDAAGKGAPVAPGSLAQIYGTNLGCQAHALSVPLPTDPLGGVSVTFNGIPAPMLDVSPSPPYPVLAVQVPFGALPAGQQSGTADVVVTVDGIAAAPVKIPLIAAAPGVFSYPVGVGNAIAVNLDGQIAAPLGAIQGSHPVTRGDTLIILATGLGSMTPAVPDAQGVPVGSADLQPIVLIGGVKAQVGFAGQFYGYPSVNQINVTVPGNAPVGSAIPLQIQSGLVISTDKVTIAVQ